MFCPKCGSNQGEEKRFCTVCVTNLAEVSQALTGQIPQPNDYAPPIPHPLELERQRAMAKGFRLSIVGGGVVALKILDLVFSSQFRDGSFFWLWTSIGIILLTIGILKIIASRSPNAGASPALSQTHLMQQTNPRPLFSRSTVIAPAVPQTSELKPVSRHAPSVTEGETRHLPHSKFAARAFETEENASMYCPSCGTKADDRTTYCARCGVNFHCAR